MTDIPPDSPLSAPEPDAAPPTTDTPPRDGQSAPSAPLVAGMRRPLDEFRIYATGLCSASVCSSLPQREVERRMAGEMTGVGPWLFAHGEKFATGQPNPCPCNKQPETHKHFLFHC